MRNNKFFTYKLHSQPVTRLLSLGSSKKEPGFFISGASNGEVVVWQEEPEFIHLFHKEPIVSITQASGSAFSRLILTCDHTPHLSLWKPAMFNYFNS